MHVLARDVLTGKVTEYTSIAECARKLGWATTETICFRLKKSKFGQVFQEGLQFKLKSDTRDWVIPSDPELEIKKARQAISVVLRNCATGEIKHFDTMSEAAKLLGISDSTLAYRFTNDVRSPIMGHQVKLGDDQREFGEFTEEEVKKSFVPNSLVVYAKNLLTNEERTYSSVRSCCRELRPDKAALYQGRQVLTAAGWLVKVGDEDWMEIDDPVETIYRAQREVMCRKEGTGDIIIANSSFELSAILSLDPKALREAAFTRGKKVYHGYRFRLGVSSEPWPDTQI